MRSVLSIWVLFWATAAFAGQSMTVAVCDVGQVPGAVIAHAEYEAAYVFQTMDVKIHWMDCGADIGAADSRRRPDFIVRVQMGGHVTKAGPVSLEAMGRAFMDRTGYGFMVDTYYGEIRHLTLLFPLANSDQLLGYVMVHELGHLLIGPGHRARGIMRAAWGKVELEALNQRHLRFNAWERAVIVHSLQMREAASATVPRMEPQ